MVCGWLHRGAREAALALAALWGDINSHTSPSVPRHGMLADTRLPCVLVCWRRGKTNFFEKRVGDYQKSGVMSGLKGETKSKAFSVDEDF